MKKRITLSLLAICLFFSTDSLAGHRLTVKKSNYYIYSTTNNKTIRVRCQYIYLSAMPREFSNVNRQIDAIDGCSAGARSGSIWVSESQYAFADTIKRAPMCYIYGELKSNEKMGLPFLNFNIGSDTITYAQIKSTGIGQLASYKNGPISMYTSHYSQSRQKVSMTDTTGKLLFSTNLYFPLILNVTTNPTFGTDRIVPMLHAKTDSITLHWNKDTCNPNGVTIVLSESRCTQRTYIFEVRDNGTFTIDHKYISGIVKNNPPDDNSSKNKRVVFMVQLYRGDSQTVTGTDGRQYNAQDYSRWQVMFQAKK